MSTSSSLDSLRTMGIPLRVERVVTKRLGAGPVSFKIIITGGRKLKVRDLSSLTSYAHMISGDLEGLSLTNNLLSLAIIGQFLFCSSVRIERGKTCFNKLSGRSRRLGASSSCGVYFRPDSGVSAHGRVRASPSSARWVDIHLEDRKVFSGEVTNAIVPTAGTMYLIGGVSDVQVESIGPRQGAAAVRAESNVRINWWRQLEQKTGMIINVMHD